jgi:hypothetical protein
MKDIFDIRLKLSNSNSINESELVLFNADENELMHASHTAENDISAVCIN